MGLTHAAIKRIARKAGAKRISKDVYETVMDMYEDVLEKIVKASFKITDYRRKRTVTLGDVRHALKILKLGTVHIDPGKQKVPEVDIPLAPFRKDMSDVLRDSLPDNLPWKPRFTADAVNAIRSFVTNYMFRYLRSTTGLKGHCGAKTIAKRDLQNVHTVCVDFPGALHQPKCIVDDPHELMKTKKKPKPKPKKKPKKKQKPKKKPKKKKKAKLTRTGTEIYSDSSSGKEPADS